MNILENVKVQLNVDVFLLLVFFTAVFVSLCCVRQSCRQSCMDAIRVGPNGYADMSYEELWEDHSKLVKENIADYFTKALPLLRHRALAPFIALDPSSVSCRPRLDFSPTSLV